ncbi:hypothetical protein PHYBLDRAFT_63074 [Phycomyces blakesleeanus NRRL 1555(-)]|uniref:Transmembrane protein n=1 Tax=Phycomyces blakesleeanus (strain ATCC 8743b / DSM 1359 / FGSC 10004 / NBRC 33097 / NRRL 1555) TaxID=763407 RepID=A0A163E574_PHYB8|nr:hypothetical protein PHYBLDRAFT_63074 [Phycomyces blakesleeanus NRRL 1555(-)]OAD76720.1 hypothetical protein PHYBLDRAFT_63074 [Phycomyces blakesleeanus NRRL 1555(-)]|eukprot:XP_018294760.1 hypothetical protein PHYBLDRAFT_63074 [Phycomyces blakesleeanus NRRL 1555(-)]
MSRTKRPSLILQGKMPVNAEYYKKFSSNCEAILLNISLFIGLTHIVFLSLFHLMFPESDSTKWDQIKLSHAGKKITICGPVESKSRPPKISIQTVQTVRYTTMCIYMLRKVKKDRLLSKKIDCNQQDRNNDNA